MPARRATVGVVTAVSLVGISTVLLPTAAGASGSTFTLTGQAAGTLKWVPQTTGKYGTPLHGCQVGQESTQIVVNFPATKLTVNGHPAAATAIVAFVTVTKVGGTEQNAGTKSHFVLDLNVGSHLYAWEATSGSVSTKAKANGGSVDAGLLPIGQVTGTAVQSGLATKPVHISGSWASCNPWP